VLLTAAEAKLASLEAEKRTVLEHAKEEAEAEKARLAEQTESDIRKMREQTAGELTRLAQLTRIELRRFSAQESVRLAEEKLRSKIDAKNDEKLVKAGIQAMGGLN